MEELYLTIRNSIYFTFDGRRSTDYSIMNVNVDGGMIEEFFGASKSINEEKIRGRSRPYFQGVEKEPLEFTVEFAFQDQWNEQLIRDVRNWLLDQDDYKPLTFANNPEKIYYVICIDEPRLIHTSLKNGYVKLHFRCNDSYAFSPQTRSENYIWEDEPIITEQHIDFSNGEKHGLVLDNDNHLTISNEDKTWENLSLSATWQDI